MSYVDPYAGPQGYSSRLRKPTYDQSYDPYSDPQNPSAVRRPTYDDQPPYDNTYPPRSETSIQGHAYDVQEPYEYGGQPLGQMPAEEPSIREYQDEAYPAMARQKTSKNLRQWRYATQRASWTAGGRARCLGRFCCCTIMTTAFFVISILLTLALWARPPNVSVNGVQFPTTGSTILIQQSGLSINLGVNISVANPNYFSIAFTELAADIFYPINNTKVGGGKASNLDFKAGETTNFTFPFTITYTFKLDPQHVIVADLARKCGFGGGKASDLTVNYAIKVGIRFLLLTISPVIRNSFAFPCPLSESDLETFLRQAGLTIGDILNGLN